MEGDEMNSVKLVSCTRPSIDVLKDGISDPQDLIAYCARVSNPENQSHTETYPKLVKYLIDNKHWSPLEMIDVTMEINTTRDIARQLLRHRSFSFQEFSQRYADARKLSDSLVYRSARLQDKKNRQNSLPSADEELNAKWTEAQMNVEKVVISYYNWAIENGIAKEVARAILPEGMTMSKLYMKGSLRSWLHYIDVRTDASTQYEHRELAIKVSRTINMLFPVVSDKGA
jgi:thymidylate synthase (FAD)